MTIQKTKANSFRVEVYLPKDITEKLGIPTKRLKKTVKTRKEAIRLESTFLAQINQVRLTGSLDPITRKKDTTFGEFYHQIWLPAYLDGSTGHAGRLPKKSTSDLTQRLFRLHILPLFGKLTLRRLNNDPSFIVDKLTEYARTFANVKQLASYTAQVFSEANYRKFIVTDNISPEIHRVAPIKKMTLRKQRQENGGDALTVQELLAWITAVDTDLKSNKLTFQDFVLFHVTLALADRKSESYALRWEDINLTDRSITVTHSLDEHGKLQTTKGNKKTKFQISADLSSLLQSWKVTQKKELSSVGIGFSPKQFVFTYTNSRGEINQPVHPFYLNSRLKSIHKRHPNLRKTHPHALRHTVATVLSEAGMSLDDISKALTHSDTRTTKIYVDAPNIVNLKTHNTFESYLDKSRNSLKSIES